jgi:hypothetical protein
MFIKDRQDLESTTAPQKKKKLQQKLCQVDALSSAKPVTYVT